MIMSLQHAIYSGAILIASMLIGGCNNGNSQSANEPSTGGIGSQDMTLPLALDGIDTSGLPTVGRAPGSERGSFLIQVNLARDGDFSEPDNVANGGFGYDFADTSYFFYPIDSLSFTTRMGTLGGRTLQNDSGRLVLSIGYDSIELLAVAFGDETYDWYALYLETDVAAPQGSDLIYQGGSLETANDAAGVSQTANTIATVSVDTDNALMQLKLDDERGLVLRGENVTIIDNLFRGAILNDDGGTVGVIDGAFVRDDDLSKVIAVYSYKTDSGGRAAGILGADLQ